MSVSTIVSLVHNCLRKKQIAQYCKRAGRIRIRQSFYFCNIGPKPFGDGIVDVQDLIVLAEHLFEEIPPVEEVE